jgi:hypothetical protein
MDTVCECLRAREFIRKEFAFVCVSRKGSLKRPRGGGGDLSLPGGGGIKTLRCRLGGLGGKKRAGIVLCSLGLGSWSGLLRVCSSRDTVRRLEQ